MSKLNEILSKVLSIEAGSIRDDLTAEDVPTWDSLNSLILVSDIERTFSVKLTMEEVSSIKSVKDIRTTLQTHGVDV